MKSEMFGYFEELVLWLSTGRVKCKIKAESRTSVCAYFQNGRGEDSIVLDEQQLRDVLDAMRRAKKAVALLDAELPEWYRKVEE